MLRVLLYAYVVVSLGVHAASFRQSLKDREPTYLVLLQVATSLFVLAGIVAYAFGVHHGLAPAWRIIGPPFVATYLWLAASEVLQAVKARDPELSETEDRVTTAIGILLATVVLGPGLWLNFLVAKGA